MKDRTGSYTITRDQDCFTINLTILSDLDLYIYSSNEKLYYDACVIRTLITHGTFVVLSCVILRATREALGEASPINAVHT